MTKPVTFDFNFYVIQFSQRIFSICKSDLFDKILSPFKNDDANQFDISSDILKWNGMAVFHIDGTSFKYLLAIFSFYMPLFLFFFFWLFVQEKTQVEVKHSH